MCMFDFNADASHPIEKITWKLLGDSTVLHHIVWTSPHRMYSIENGEEKKSRNCKSHFANGNDRERGRQAQEASSLNRWIWRLWAKCNNSKHWLAIEIGTTKKKSCRYGHNSMAAALFPLFHSFSLPCSFISISPANSANHLIIRKRKNYNIGIVVLDWCAARPIHFLVSTQFCSPFYYSAHRGHAFSLLLCATTQYAFLHMVEKIVEHRPTKKNPAK